MANYKILEPFVLSYEGGFVNNKKDRGGATNKGVTLATFRSIYGASKTVDDLKALTNEQWEFIFKTYYWDKCKADEIQNQSVANLLVDFAWHSGVGRASRYLQQVVGVEQDGIIGKQTIAAVNNYAKGQWVLFDALKVARMGYLMGLIRENPTQETFRKGWMNRLKGIQYGTLTYNKKTIKV